MLNGPVRETERSSHMMVSKIKSDFLDFSTKGKASVEISPLIIDYNKSTLLSSLEEVKEKINESITILDLTKTCLLFELPIYGFLTRIEALHFVLFHTQRHIHQLQNIYQIVIIK